MDIDSRQEQTSTHDKKRDPLIGTTVAKRHEIVALLGRGATTTVYKAKDTQLKRLEAVKILRTDAIFNEETIKRFDQECRTLGLLKHPNIVTLYGNGITDSDQPFIVMEFVDGVSLKQLIDNEGSIEIKRAIPIFEQTCAGLAAAHERGVVHRDMKPANIMITKDAQGHDLVKILDFGVAKILIQGETFQTKTQTGEMLGTLLYMSPEQCLDQMLDGRCDVYSMGCVMFEALTGKPPLVGRTAFETMNKHLTEMPDKMAKVRPDLKFSTQLESIVRRAVAKNPKDRFQKITDLQHELSKVSAGAEGKANIPLPLKGQAKVNAPKAVKPSFIDYTKQRIEAPSKPRDIAIFDPSRETVLHFLAIEALQSDSWKERYASKISQYAIDQDEVLILRNRLALAHSVAWKEVKQYALDHFDKLDINKDSFISKGELIALLRSSNLSSRERSFISFLLQHADEIISSGKVIGESIGISRFHIYDFFLDVQSEK